MLRLGVLSHSIQKNGRVVSVPSLHRESTDSLINILVELMASVRAKASYVCALSDTHTHVLKSQLLLRLLNI